MLPAGKGNIVGVAVPCTHVTVRVTPVSNGLADGTTVSVALDSDTARTAGRGSRTKWASGTMLMANGSGAVK